MFVREIGIVFQKRRYILIGFLLLAETVERHVLASASAIKSALDRHYSAACVVLHVVGEDHQLRDIDEAAESFVGEAVLVHALALGKHTTGVIRFLHLNKDQRKTVDKECYIRSELVLAVAAGELRREMVQVLLGMVEIYEFIRRHGNETMIERFAQIVIVEFLLYLA